LQTVGHVLAAAFEVTKRLHAAGNISDLDLAKERAQVEEAKVQLRTAEVTVRESQAQLNTVMGLWGEETAWRIDQRLPDIPEESLPFEGLERQALRQSLDLASARQRLVVRGEQVGVAGATMLIHESSLEAGAEREKGEWKVGPTIEFPIPLFNQGQGRLGRAVAELRRAEQDYYALGVRIRSTARLVQARLQGAEDRARYYRDTLRRNITSIGTSPSCSASGTSRSAPPAPIPWRRRISTC
jgi:cobalt-zinc-cadmium efflux system outer membrane protein